MLPELERRRLRALVEADPIVLPALHADDFVLVNPSGAVWTREQYLGGVLSGEIDYRVFEAVSEIEVLRDGGLAVLRYRSKIDINVGGQEPGPLECWHTDIYRLADTWRAVRSQATEIVG